MAESFPFPDDLLAAQKELHQVTAELAELSARLPWSVEPMPGFSEGDGWRARERPDSPGWTDEEKAEVDRLRERKLELSFAVSGHAFWKTLDTGAVVKARMALKHAHEQPEDDAAGQ
ncbi:hypothetical protein [Streptomyces sp. URMC 123]|uniref:hypothetical protein n=1 Tax=Streptomyces sp. URMC 123 TaxID=3423403 RepID=UPI003F1A0B2D